VVTAIVLVKADIQRVPEVAEMIAQFPQVSEVYSVTGEFDLVAIIRVRAHEELADVIPGGLNKVPGVIQTATHVAFRAYSRHDLEAAFSLGGLFKPTSERRPGGSARAVGAGGDHRAEASPLNNPNFA
jgi:DNA-binding Lrp family transcriptional regulator